MGQFLSVSRRFRPVPEDATRCGPYFIAMTKDIASFEQELQDLFLAGVDDEFATWVQEAVAALPVNWDSVGDAADVVGFLKMGLIMMSGYQ